MVQAGVIAPEHLTEALHVQRQKGGKLGTILIQNGLVTEEQLIRFLAEQCGIQFIHLSEVSQFDPEMLVKVPESLARQHLLFPVSIKDGTLNVAVADPLNVLVLDDLR